MPNASEKIADNQILTAVARVSMALSLPVLGVLAYLFNAQLESKFSAQDVKITAVKDASDNQSKISTARIETVERSAQTAIDQAGAVNNRLSVVETKQNETAVSNERFQAATLQRLDRMSDALVSQSNAISALTATIQSAYEERRKNGN